jgi:hypothetical protein
METQQKQTLAKDIFPVSVAIVTAPGVAGEDQLNDDTKKIKSFCNSYRKYCCGRRRLVVVKPPI